MVTVKDLIKLLENCGPDSTIELYGDNNTGLGYIEITSLSRKVVLNTRIVNGRLVTTQEK
jgi:hypothetical protein